MKQNYPLLDGAWHRLTCGLSYQKHPLKAGLSARIWPVETTKKPIKREFSLIIPPLYGIIEVQLNSDKVPQSI